MCLRDLVLDPYLRNASLDLLMDAVLLWVTAAVAKRSVRWPRLLAGAGVGGLYNFWLALANDGYLSGWSWLSSPVVFWVVLPMMMLAAAFAPIRCRRAFSLYGVLMFIAVLSVGLASAFRYFLALRGMEFSPFFCVLLEIGMALAVAELGWGVVNRRMMAGICRVPLRVVCGNWEVAVDAFLDTGNHLRDPVSQKAVIIMDYDLIRPFLTSAIRATIETVGNGSPAPPPPEDPYATRLRLIPFRSVQHGTGLLPGLRVDRAVVGREGNLIYRGDAVIGLDLSGSLRNEEYRALIPSSLWSAPAAVGGREEVDENAAMV